LAAAKQAVLLGTRGIAFSTPVEDNEPDLTALEPAVTMALQLVIQRQKERLLNVNIPLNSKGVKWTRQSALLIHGPLGLAPKGLQDSDDMSRQQTALAVNCRLL
jgi:5'-nucleotidase